MASEQKRPDSSKTSTEKAVDKAKSLLVELERLRTEYGTAAIESAFARISDAHQNKTTPPA